MGHFGRHADPPRLVRVRAPRAGAELLRAGRAAARATRAPPTARSTGSSRTGAADPDGRAGDGGDGDRLAGGDLRRVQRDPAGRAARLPAAPDDPPHLRARRADLRAGGQLGAVRGGRRARDRLRLLDQAGLARTASRSPARWRSTRSCSSSSCRMLWHKPLWMAVAGAAGFLVVDLAFFTANLTKIPHGGWFPLVVAGVLFTVLMTWRRGREIVTRAAHRGGGAAAGVRRPAARHRRAAHARPRHRGVPQRGRGHDAARAPLQRRAQPRAARARGRVHDRDRRHPARATRTSGSRSTSSSTRTTASRS